MASNHFIKLEQFEGPLDLLLHLIKAHEVDIFTIDLYMLTLQYLDILRMYKFRDLRDAASFMEMAATLIEIKSRNLLPTEQDGEQEEADEDDDPTLSLQKRLFEYETFKNAGLHLADHGNLDTISKSNHEFSRLEPLYEHITAPLKGDRNTLLILYEQMLSTLDERLPMKVSAVTESITVEEVLDKIAKYIEKLKFVMFQQLYPKITTRYELVAHVLAMLQHVRDRNLKIYQEDFGGPIWMYRKDLEVHDLKESWLKDTSNQHPEHSLTHADVTNQGEAVDDGQK